MDDEIVSWANRAAHLFFLEQRAVTLSAQLHELTRQRNVNRDKALRLRTSLTGDEAAEYETMKLEAAVTL